MQCIFLANKELFELNSTTRNYLFKSPNLFKLHTTPNIHNYDDHTRPISNRTVTSRQRLQCTITNETILHNFRRTKLQFKQLSFFTTYFLRIFCKQREITGGMILVALNFRRAINRELLLSTRPRIIYSNRLWSESL